MRPAASAAALETHGAVDVLVGNAGVMALSPLEALRVEEWERMVDVDVRGLLHGIAAALPIMQRPGSGAIEQPDAVDVNEIVVRPTAQG